MKARRRRMIAWAAAGLLLSVLAAAGWLWLRPLAIAAPSFTVEYPRLPCPWGAGREIHPWLDFRDRRWSDPGQPCLLLQLSLVTHDRQHGRPGPEDPLPARGEIRAILHREDGTTVAALNAPVEYQLDSGGHQLLFGVVDCEFPLAPDPLHAGWIELEFPGFRYWLEIPYGCAGGPAGIRTAHDPRSVPEPSCPAVVGAITNGQIISWQAVQCAFPTSAVPWKLDAAFSASGHGGFETELYSEEYRDRGGWSARRPAVSASLRIPGMKPCSADHVRTRRPDDCRRHDEFSFTPGSLPAGRYWGELAIRVDRRVCALLVPGSLFHPRSSSSADMDGPQETEPVVVDSERRSARVFSPEQLLSLPENTETLAFGDPQRGIGADIDDDDLAALSRLPALRVLDAGHCGRLTTASLRLITACRRLEEVALSGDGLFEPGFDALASLPRLRRLCVYNCEHLNASALNEIVRIGSLVEINLGAVPWMTDADLRILAVHPGLRSLKLGWAERLTDAGFRTLGSMPGLRSLAVGNADAVTSNGVACLSALSNLESLEFWGMLLGDPAVEAIARIPSLRHVKLTSMTCITDRSLVILERLPALESVEMSHGMVSEGLLEALNERLRMRGHR